MSTETSAGAPPPQGASSWRTAVPPVLLSLLLSALTVGSKVHWRDSGIYLVAIKEFSVLYPPGFALYLSLCKAWTLLLGPFLDFTLSVHLFSSLCAALAAGFLTRAAERWTGDRVAAAVIGCLAAAGYTWWFSGLYAKGYALYFMIVALLLWRMACRDHVRVLLLLGLAWAAHPSAVLLGPAALLYLHHHRAEVLALGRLRLSLLAPAVVLCAIGPSLFLPLIAARESIYSLGHPSSLHEWTRYVAGARFTGIPGVWGFDGGRWARMALYAWEEFLGVGVGLAAFGVTKLFRDRRPERWMLVAWILPVAVVAALFKIEEQYDFWLVVAWMPLWLAAALGLSLLRARQRRAPAIAVAIGLLWSAAANGKDLYLRGDDLPETLGRCMLGPLDRGAMLVASSDDALGLCRYLQVVRGFRPDVRVVPAPLMNPLPELRWFQDRLARAWPGFALPDYSLVQVQAARYSDLALVQAAIIQAQRAGSAPVFFDQEPAVQLLTSGAVVPAGFLWKWTEGPARPEPRYWEYPVTLEQVAAHRGRKRALSVTYGAGHVFVAPQTYEDRFIYYLVEARRNLADLQQREGSPAGYGRSAEAYESILKSAPDFENVPRILYPLALDYFMLDRPNQAVPLFRRLLDTDAGPMMKAGAWFYLGEIYQASRRKEEARDFFRRALEIVPPESPLKQELEKRLRSP
jgi:tetratricopeptide (TPR) repeat protein